SVTDERGTETEYTIQPLTGLRTQERVTDEGSNTLRVTDFEYNDLNFAGFLTKRTIVSNTSALGDMVTEYVADDNGRVLDEIVQAGNNLELITSYTYTGNGSKKTVQDAKGYVTTFEYEAGTLRLKKVIHPDATFKELSYDAHGNVLWERDESGLKTFHEYDVLNRRLKTTVDLNGNGVANARYSGSGTFNGTDLVPTYNGDLVVETTYNAFNLPVTVKDGRGITTEHGYDAIGRRTSTTRNSTASSSADKLITTYSYSGANAGGSIFAVSGFKPTSTTDPRGFVTTVTYDDLYRPTQVTLTDTSYTPHQVVTTETEYDAVGNVISATDALGRVSTTEYDGLNRPTVVHLPSGGGVAAATKQMFYTSAGPAWKSIDELGRDSLSFYDNAGRVIRVEGAVVDDGTGTSTLARPKSRTAYDANSNVVAVEDALGRISETVYDNRNRPIEVKAPYVADATTGTWQRPTSTMVYDTMGRPISVTDPLGNITETSYDRAGRATAVKRPAVEVYGQSVQATYTRSKYDAAGNVVETMDARGRIMTNLYDAFSRMTRTTDALGYQTNFKYDKGSHRTEVKDANNRVTTFTYDGQSRVLTETSGAGGLAGPTQTTTFGYDKVNKVSRTDALNRQTTYAYDVRNRLTTVTYVSGAQGMRSYGYDAAGQMLSVTESAQPAADVAYTYDALGRVSSEESRGFTHAYTYDLGGNRVATSFGTGRSETRSFDALNRPVSLTENGRTTSYYYDLAGRAVGQLSGNGQWGTSHYDAQGRLVRRTLREGAGGTQPVMAELAFHYDAVGNLRQQEEWWPGEISRSGVRATQLAYDNGDRLRQELVNDGAVQTSTSYSYDKVGNRLNKAVHSNGVLQKQTGYASNSRNQLIAWSESNGSGIVQRSASMTYDAAGNRITQNITPAGGSAQSTTYAWDYDNRLTSVTLPGSLTHTYGYDYRTRRITRSEPGGNPVAMTYSGGLSVAEYEVTDPLLGTLGALPEVEYQRGPDMGGGVGGLLYSLRSGTAKFNLSNGRGDVVAQSDSTGALTWTASYEAYGKRPVETGSNADRQRANTKEEDPTGLLNEGFRYRDLETGVWLSKDPAGFVDGPNLYAYVQQNPWTSWDPLGLTGYNDLLNWGAEQAAEENYVGFVGAVVLASAWEMFSFGAAKKNDDAFIKHSNGDLNDEQLVKELAVNTVTATGKAVVVYGTGGLAGASASVPTAMLVGGGTGATVGTLEVVNNRTNAAIEGTEYQGTVGSDVTDVLVNAATGAAVAGTFQLSANTIRAWMEGYARGSLPAFNGTTTGNMVTNQLEYVNVTNGPRSGARHPYVMADGHAETNAAQALNMSRGSEGVVYHNNPKGTCGNCNKYTGGFLLPGKSLNVVPPPNAVAPKPSYNVNPKVHRNTGKSAYESP
ncbi:MAG: RHS repeat-associated core domain-containing protein, partial [Roseimicrobium sp.]